MNNLKKEFFKNSNYNSIKKNKTPKNKFNKRSIKLIL